MIETPVKSRPILEFVSYFLRLGTFGFGGPVALVGEMERELVTERGWLSKEQMREAIAVCQSPSSHPLLIDSSYLNRYKWS